MIYVRSDCEQRRMYVEVQEKIQRIISSQNAYIIYPLIKEMFASQHLSKLRACVLELYRTGPVLRSKQTLQID